MDEPQILRPFNRAEAISVEEAARIAGKSPRTIREWCQIYDIGRRIAGRWAVSRVALQMLLDGDKAALAAYWGATAAQLALLNILLSAAYLFRG